MAEVIATSLLKVVVDKLSSTLIREFWTLMGLDKELRRLEGTLSTVRDVLGDAEARQVKEKALQGWLRELKEVAYDADDLLDEIASRADDWRPEKGSSKVRNHLLRVAKSPVFCRKVAHRIKEIRERLDEIAEQRSKFHLREGFVCNNESEIGVRETGSLVEESEVYGRIEEKQKIVDLLVSDTEEPNPEVVAIVGLGGLGKTTLAQVVYNDDRVLDHFELKMWVWVSMDFDIKRIYRSILESVTGREYNLNDINLMQRSLREHLEKKRFLLVLDDVWDESHENWDRLRIALASGAIGSRVLVTTRSRRVASVMGSCAPCPLTGLSDDDCWALFEKRAFGVGGAEKTPVLEAIGKEIVKKCGGVPLAAKALGSLMHFKREEGVWLAIKESEVWRLSDDENEILPALKLSYSHLPSRLKQCFAYCSIFPRSSEIHKETLVHLWIAEGFVRSSDGNGAVEDVGLQFIDELLSRSLFQSDEENFIGKAGTVRIHDLVYDLARSVAGDEFSVIDSSTARGLAENLRYSSFICDGGVSSIMEPLRAAEKLRTLRLIVAKEMDDDQGKAQELLQALFKNSRLLRAAYLSSLPVKTLPNSTKKLNHLRYLNLSHSQLEALPLCIARLRHLENLQLNSCRHLSSLPDCIGDLLNLWCLNLSCCFSLSSVPTSIGRLKKLRRLDLSFCPIQTLPETLSCLSNLQTLELIRCYFVHELPKNMKNMTCLEHLGLYGCYSLTCLPAGIAQLTNLQTLPLFVLGGSEGDCRIAELGSLNLKGKLEILGLETVSNAEEALAANLKEKYGVRSLTLRWTDSMFHGLLQQVEGDNGKVDAEKLTEEFMAQWHAVNKSVEDVLVALQPNAGLEELSLVSFQGRELPRWTMELSLPRLAKFTLSNCTGCERLPPLGQLPCLKVLTLDTLPSVMKLGAEFYGGRNSFPSLEELNLTDMPELREWSRPNEEEEEGFPRLAKLRLSGCAKLKALPATTFPSVRDLDMDVDDPLMLSSLQNGAFPNVQHLGMRNYDEDEDLPEVLSDLKDSVKSWTAISKRKPSESTSSFGFGSCKVDGSGCVMEIPLW